MKPLNLQTNCWLQNSYAARVAWHRRQARITLALGVVSLALLCWILCLIFC